jgi:hypothetical protein
VLEIAALRTGLGFLVFGCYGTGSSVDNFVEEGMLSPWISQAIGIVGEIAGDKQQ